MQQMAVAVSPGIPKKKHNRRLAVFMLLNIVIQYNKTRALQNIFNPFNLDTEASTGQFHDGAQGLHVRKYRNKTTGSCWMKIGYKNLVFYLAIENRTT